MLMQPFPPKPYSDTKMMCDRMLVMSEISDN